MTPDGISFSKKTLLDFRLGHIVESDMTDIASVPIKEQIFRH